MLNTLVLQYDDDPPLQVSRFGHSCDKLRGMSQILHAAHFAAQRHSAQRRKGEAKEPYVNHLLEVAHILAQVNGVDDETLLVAALLHDCIEDAEVKRPELETLFGSAVADLVEEVTDDKSLPKARRKELQVEKAPHKSRQAKMIKIADKISNLRAIQNSPPDDWDLQRKQDYYNWAQKVVDGCRGCNPQLEELFDSTHRQGLASFG